MKQLIINADDFGLNTLTSQSIIDLYQLGMVTSASILTNFSAFESSAELLKNNKLDIGLHLNLLDGKPVNNKTLLTSLVDKNGFFLKSPYKLYTKIILGGIKEKELEVEIRAQIEKAMDRGIKLSHINGHQHVHMFPVIDKIILRIAGEYKIKAVRIPEEAYRASSVKLKRKAICDVIRLYSIPRKKSLSQYGLITTDYFTGIPYVGQINVALLKDIVALLPDGVTELMCHPVNTEDYKFYYDNDMQWVSNHNFIREYKAFASDEVRQYIKSSGIELINFDTLCSAGKTAYRQPYH
jgi:predicted glycoside hydrolase/deacetylase ChbG (UPF0249 family)